MIINYDITSEISVNCLTDLNKLKTFEEESSLKLNVSALARELGCDRRTARKYINGYKKPETRNRDTQFDVYFETIQKLLEDSKKIFRYKSVLYRYLSENYGMEAPESSFRRYIQSVKEFNDYFINCRSVKEPNPMRYETDIAQQAQLDWKESLKLMLKNGEVVEVNIFVLLLSYSRFRVYRLSINKTQDILFNFMTEAFETFGGVPHEILVDNMKTVMDESRTKYRSGIVNNRFQQYANDMGFKVRPCIAGRPQTKAKVESPMRILDELKAYNGDFDYPELINKLGEINNRENSKFHKAYQSIPLVTLDKEKNALNPLPTENLRRQYKITTKKVKVNKSSMIVYKSNQYSVPPKYIGKLLTIQLYDNQIHCYHNTVLVTIHSLSLKPLNYKHEHYTAICRETLPFDEDDIETIAKENLSRIGERYD